MGNVLIAFVAIALLALDGAVAYKAIHTKPTKAQPGGEPVPVYYGRVEDAMPLPPTLDPAQFERGDIREAYQAAKEIPGILAQQPCYCYCERQCHRGLLDCFRTEDAATCNICVKEALLASELHRQGKSAEEIRAAIIHGDWVNVVAKTEPTGSEVK